MNSGMHGISCRFSAMNDGRTLIRQSGVLLNLAKPADHFREVTKMMTAGKGAQRAVKDYVLTRFVLQQIFV